jgi:hypothetical protein
MNKHILIVLVMLSGLSQGCNDSDTVAASNEKSLFSSWAEDGSSFVLDLTQGSFGSFPSTFFLTTGEYCDCTIVLGGTQSGGNAAITGCAYRPGTGAGSDPGCSSLNGNFTYAKTATTLTICGSGCSTFH